MLSIILASASPRRQQLMQQIGLQFTVIPAEVEEIITGQPPLELAEKLAGKKAEWVSKRYPGAIVVAADTIVVIDNQVLGKPVDRDEARLMLQSLSGREHQVITGLAVYRADMDYRYITAETTQVIFRTLEPEDIEAYLDSGEPFDKAGAYGIQGLGALLVERIEGCYFNVVGLPLNRLGQVLRTVGVKVLGR